MKAVRLYEGPEVRVEEVPEPEAVLDAGCERTLAHDKEVEP